MELDPYGKLKLCLDADKMNTEQNTPILCLIFQRYGIFFQYGHVCKFRQWRG